MSVPDHLISVSRGTQLVESSPGETDLHLAQSTAGQPRVKGAGRRAAGKAGSGAASHGRAVSRVLWVEVQNSQGAAWEHFAP